MNKKRWLSAVLNRVPAFGLGAAAPRFEGGMARPVEDPAPV